MYTYGMQTFSIAESLRFGWESFKKRPWFFIAITILVTVAGWAVGFVGGFVGALLGTNAFDKAVGTLISFAGQILIGMGTIAFYLRAHDSVTAAEAQHLWHPRPFWKYTGVNILNGLIVIFGLILLIVPGIIWALMFMFAQYFVIEHQKAPLDALRESARITNGHKWQLLLFVLAVTGINILGALCLFVGLLVSIPVTTLATVHAYHTLSKNT